MTNEEQLRLWVEGQSIHQDEAYLYVTNEWGQVIDRTPLPRGQCVPDFSCCYPELLADEGTRQRYLQACEEDDEEMVIQMSEMFTDALSLLHTPDPMRTRQITMAMLTRPLGVLH
jgi:hypothetical protein